MGGDNRKRGEKERSAEQMKTWWGLRTQGWTMQMIADEYGCSAANVTQRLNKYRNSLPKENYDQYIQIQLERLEGMRRALQEGIDAGNPRTIEVALQLENRIAKLLGLDKPDKVEMEVVDNTPEVIKEALQRRRNKRDNKG